MHKSITFDLSNKHIKLPEKLSKPSKQRIRPSPIDKRINSTIISSDGRKSPFNVMPEGDRDRLFHRIFALRRVSQ